MRRTIVMLLLALTVGSCAYKRALKARLQYEPTTLQTEPATAYPVRVGVMPFHDSVEQHISTGTRKFVGATFMPLWPIYSYQLSGLSFFKGIQIEKTIARDLHRYGIFQEVEALTSATGPAYENKDLIVEGEINKLGIYGKITHYGLGFPVVGIPIALVIHGAGLPAEYGVHFRVDLDLTLRERETGDLLWKKTVELRSRKVAGGFYYGNPARRLNEAFSSMTVELARDMITVLPKPDDNYWALLLARRQQQELPSLVTYDILYPRSVEETKNETIRFTGSLESRARIETVKILCNGQPVELPESITKALPANRVTLDGCTVTLDPGENTIQIAVTAADRTDSKEFRVTRSGGTAIAQVSPPPKLPITPTVVGPRETGHRWAVLVGISEYEKIGEGQLRPLMYAARDAAALAQFLRSPEGGRFQRVHLLVDADATRAKILAALNDLEGAQPEDVVVVFFAGHGIADPQRPETGFLLTHESDPTNRGALEASSIPWYQFNQKLRNLRADKKLVMVDACHAATVLPSLRAVGVAKKNVGRSLADELRKTLPSTCFLAASGAYENSQENPQWGGGHGAFTWALLRALRGEADRAPYGDGDGLVRLGEMMGFVKDIVPRETRDLQHPQDSGTYDRRWPLAKVTDAP